MDSWDVHGAFVRQKVAYRERPLAHWTGMKKKKPGIFSATKAVKANARERVGQPKPARVVDTEPRIGRAAKHKTKLEEMVDERE
jgi:hypothetical protein